MKSYGQRCPVTRALDLVGDRWTLVIVRDLLDGPRRFARLRADLTGISPTLLAQRLDRLVVDGLAERSDDGYRLTSRGEALAPVVDELGRWGLDLMTRSVGSSDDAFHDHFRRLGLRFVVRPEAILDGGLRVAVDVDGECYDLVVDGPGTHDRITIEPAASAPADATLTIGLAAAYAMRRGRTDVERLEADGILSIDAPTAVADVVRAALLPADAVTPPR